MALYNLISNAKINFGLKVINKRPDGFHNLETIFYPLKLSDNIQFSIEPAKSDHNSVKILTNKDYIPLNEKNLCYKAIEKFFVGFEITEKFHFTISLTKFIPVGGGLGGGSANAASILKTLVKHFGIDIASNREKIIEIALNVGSDVPFFLIGKPCFAQSRGEILRKLDRFNLKKHSLMVVNPGVHVSTKWAFDSLGMKEGEVRDSKIGTVETFSSENLNLLQNDFEECVFKKYDLIRDLKNMFKDSGAVFTSMSGTGASVFGVFHERENMKERDSLATEFRRKKYFVFEQSM